MYSNGPFARPLARSLALLTHSLAPYCSLRSRAPLHFLTCSRAQGKGIFVLDMNATNCTIVQTFFYRYEGTHVNKRIQLVGSGFAPGSLMMWDGNKDKGAWIVKSWPQYALATPKGDRHIWYRGTFQFELNNGNFYSGYWEMDIHFRYKSKKEDH